MFVLDASAILAFLQGEPGSERVGELIHTSQVSAVNYSEVMAKLAEKGVGEADRQIISNALPCNIVDFGRAQAEAAAALRPLSKSLGLSFADRACLALTDSTDYTAITADRIWSELDIGIKVELIR